MQFCTLTKLDYTLLAISTVTSILFTTAHLTHCTSLSASGVLCTGYTGILASLIQSLMISVCITRLSQLDTSIWSVSWYNLIDFLDIGCMLL